MIKSPKLFEIPGRKLEDEVGLFCCRSSKDFFCSSEDLVRGCETRIGKFFSLLLQIQEWQRLILFDSLKFL